MDAQKLFGKWDYSEVKVFYFCRQYYQLKGGRCLLQRLHRSDSAKGAGHCSPYCGQMAIKEIQKSPVPDC